MILLPINLLTLILLVTSSHQSKNIEPINQQEDPERVFKTAHIVGGKNAANLGITFAEDKTYNISIQSN